MADQWDIVWPQQCPQQKIPNSVDLPIDSMVMFHSYVNVYQRVEHDRTLKTYKHPKKNNGHVFDLCFIFVFFDLFCGRGLQCPFCLTWPCSFVAKLASERRAKDFGVPRTARGDDFVHCKKLQVGKLLGELLGETNMSMYWRCILDGLLLWSITMHSFFISLWWEKSRRSFYRQDQIDKCCAFRIVLPQFSAVCLWGCWECRDFSGWG